MKSSVSCYQETAAAFFTGLPSGFLCHGAAQGRKHALLESGSRHSASESGIVWYATLSCRSEQTWGRTAEQNSARSLSVRFWSGAVARMTAL